MRRVLSVLLIIPLLFLLAGMGQAAFPEKNVNFIIGYSAGGNTDLISRTLAPEMEKVLEVEVVPQNLPGAGGAIGAQKIASSTPGYYLGLFSKSLVLMQYTGYGNINLKDFVAVAQVAEDTSALAVPADAPYNTLQEFIDYARKHPGEIRMANTGTGALWHLGAVLFAKAAGIEVEHIPYEGSSKATVACASKEVDVIAVSPPELKGLVDSNELKVLAINSDTRHPLFPEVPTAAEAGLDYQFPVWRGVFAASGTSPEALKKLNESIKAAVESDSFKEFMNNAGLPIKYRGPEEFGKLVAEEDTRYNTLLEELGLKVSEPQ